MQNLLGALSTVVGVVRFFILIHSFWNQKEKTTRNRNLSYQNWIKFFKDFLNTMTSSTEPHALSSSTC